MLLLNYLGSLGYRASPSKAQLCSPTVVYLGIQLRVSKTVTSDQVLSSVGLTIPDRS